MGRNKKAEVPPDTPEKERQARTLQLDAIMREAAAVDGTRPWRMFWKIEFPKLRGVLGIALFIRFIDGFRVFDNIYVLVGPGPGGVTTSMSIYIYEAFFRQGDIGRALAASILLFGTAFLVLSLLGRVARRAG